MPPVIEDEAGDDDEIVEAEKRLLAEQRRRFEEALKSESNKGFLDRRQNGGEELDEETVDLIQWLQEKDPVKR